LLPVEEEQVVGIHHILWIVLVLALREVVFQAFDQLAVAIPIRAQDERTCQIAFTTCMVFSCFDLRHSHWLYFLILEEVAGGQMLG